MSLVQRYKDARQLAEISTKENLDSQLRKRRFAPTPVWIFTFIAVVYALFALSVYRGAQDASVTEGLLVVFIPFLAFMTVAGALFRRYLRDREHLALSIHLLEEDDRLSGQEGREDTAPLRLPSSAASVSMRSAPLASQPRIPPAQPAVSQEAPVREEPEVGGPCDRWIPNEQVPPKDKCH